MNYTCNVLIVSDPKHPEHEGKVKLFKFGKKIFDMIMDKARPTFEDETPVNVFDIFSGANFRLRMRQVEGYPSYDKSEFEGNSELCAGDEDKMLKALNSRFDLKEFLDKKNFKTYEELSRKLAEVLDQDAVPFTTASGLAEKAKVLEPAYIKSAPAPTPKVVVEEEDDVMNYFASIANAD